MLAMAIGVTATDASTAHQGPFAARTAPGTISLSCARAGPGAGRVHVDAQVAYADLRPKVASRLGAAKRGRGTARLILLSRSGKVLAKAGDSDRLQFGFRNNHVYDGQKATLGKRASRRVLRYARGQAGCARAPKRDRLVKVVIRTRETLAKAGAARPLAVQRARLAGSSEVMTLRRASGTACDPYVCFKNAEEVLGWKREVRPFDVASVPIAPRVTPPGPRMLVGLDNGPWSYWSDFDLNSQGSDRTGNVYNFCRWQYVDSLYYYAHWLLATPPTVWVNAAHRNGVTVLGVMTGDCTGCDLEMNKLFEPQAREKTVERLYEMADAYGFDGWLIDVERKVKYSENVQKAMAELHKLVLPKSGRPVQVITYKAFKTTMDSEVLPKFKAAGEWQADYDRVNTGASPAPKASYDFLSKEHLADQRYQAYWASDMYRPYGETKPSDCNRESSANYLWNGFSCNDVARLFANQRSARAPAEDPGFYQSLALFAPGWTAFGGRSGTTDPPAPRDTFQATDERFWAGVGGYRLSGKDCTLATQAQNSVSSQISPRSPLTKVPFTTTFDTGEGEWFAVQGKTVGRRWNLLSAQDALPSEICSEGPGLQAAISYDTAFDGGSSLRVTGTTTANARRIYLYEASAQLPPKSAAVVLRYLTAGRGAPEASFWINGNGPIDQPPSETRVEGAWTYTLTDLPRAGELTRLGVSFPSSTTIDTSIGEIGVVSRGSYTPPAPIVPTEEPKRLTWEPAAATKYYNVWATPQRGSCSNFVGRTVLPLYDLDRPLFAIPGPSPQYLIQPVNESGLAAKVSPDPC